MGNNVIQEIKKYIEETQAHDRLVRDWELDHIVATHSEKVATPIDFLLENGETCHLTADSCHLGAF